jgi:hypothetical protein
MEDQRALFKRKEKIERWRTIAKDKKHEDALEEEGKEQEAEIKYVDTTKPVEIGKRSNEDRQPTGSSSKTPINEIEDVNLLFKMMEATKSRGQRQRIQRRLASITGKGKKERKSKHENDRENEVKLSAKEKIDNLLKKRDKKLEQKETQRKTKGLTPEESKIKKQIVKQKKEKNKQKNPDEDRFDGMFEKYQNKLIQKL